MPVLNPEYKAISLQIAQQFCNTAGGNKILCQASVAGRLNEYLDDVIYPTFLSKLTSGGRVFITTLEQLQNKGFRVVVVDLITGLRETGWWQVPWNYPYLGQIPSVMMSHKFYIISQNNSYSETNKYLPRITWNPEKPAYGITYVPQSVPDPITGQQQYGQGQIQVTRSTPVQTDMQTDSFDFGELLSNPLVLVALAVGAYVLLKD